MPRKLTLALVFVASLLVSVMVLMPAVVLVDRLPVLRAGGAPVQLTQVRGPWWSGQLQWQWKQLQGQARWSLDWQGLVPGVQLHAVGEDARLTGWLGADWGDWLVRDLRASVPVALVAAQIPQGNADGQADLSVIKARVGDQGIVDLQGTLQYSGGQVTWGRDGAATVPVLDGRLFMDKDQPVLTVTDPKGVTLLHARIAKQRFELKVLRAWPQLLGVSQGGNPNDVVFQMSQPVKFSAG
ncbi:MAG: type II secretion system protein N [Alcanivorax sp.]|nr:type II secretion system protein N [Alcanivorax sp.]